MARRGPGGNWRDCMEPPAAPVLVGGAGDGGAVEGINRGVGMREGPRGSQDVGGIVGDQDVGTGAFVRSGGIVAGETFLTTAVTTPTTTTTTTSVTVSAATTMTTAGVPPS